MPIIVIIRTFLNRILDSRELLDSESKLTPKKKLAKNTRSCQFNRYFRDFLNVCHIPSMSAISGEPGTRLVKKFGKSFKEKAFLVTRPPASFLIIEY